MQRPQFRPLHAEVNLAHVRHNFKTLKAMAGPGAFFCPMIKANAYGHGDVAVAKSLELEGALNFGVALVEEAIGLREQNIKSSLLVFQPIVDEISAKAMWEYQLTPVISSLEALHFLEKAAPAKGQISVHLKFNTGMNRLGLNVKSVDELKTFFATTKKIKLTGICTHLLNSEDAFGPGGRSETQFKQFARLVTAFSDVEVVGHLLNSSGLVANALAPEQKPKDMPNEKWGARPGISLYGIYPSITSNSNKLHAAVHTLDIKPVMRLVAKIVHLQKLALGETVSYGGHFQAHRSTTIAVVPIGYADGYMRRLSNKSHMLCHGHSVPVTGNVCMDFTMIDITDVMQLEQVQVGDEVVILGTNNSTKHSVDASTLANIVGTNPYEILTSVSARVPRVYVE